MNGRFRDAGRRIQLGSFVTLAGDFVDEQRGAERMDDAVNGREALIAAESPQDDLERRFWGCVIDYEDLVKQVSGKSRGATGTRRAVRTSSVRAYLSGLMRRPPADGFLFLLENRRLDLAFENVVVAFPNEFDAAAVQEATKRLKTKP